MRAGASSASSQSVLERELDLVCARAHVRRPVHAQALHTLQGHTARVQAVATCPTGRFVYSASADETVKQWSVENKKARELRLPCWTCSR